MELKDIIATAYQNFAWNDDGNGFERMKIIDEYTRRGIMSPVLNTGYSYLQTDI